MKKLLTNFSGNVLAAGLHEIGNGVAGAVQRNADGVPTAWRLLKFGPLSITQGGATRTGAFLPEHADEIVASFAQKGSRIPLDCEHFSKHLADQVSALMGVKVEEPELAALLKGERGAAGFGTLAAKADGLWLTDVEFVPRAALLMKEKMYNYFSPVFRGLANPPLRITSVALTNTPAIDNLDSLAASALAQEEATLPVRQKTEETASMNAIKKLLGLPDTATDQEVLDAVTALQAKSGEGVDAAACAAEVRAVLKLDGKAPTAEVKGKLLAFLAKAEKADADSASLSGLQSRVATMEAEKLTRDRQALIEDGVKQGKLTPALVKGFAATADVAVLTAFLKDAPVVAAPGSTLNTGDLPAAGDVLALSAEDKQVCQLTGVTEDAMLAQKKKQAGK